MVELREREPPVSLTEHLTTTERGCDGTSERGVPLNLELGGVAAGASATTLPKAPAGKTRIAVSSTFGLASAVGLSVVPLATGSADFGAVANDGSAWGAGEPPTASENVGESPELHQRGGRMLNRFDRMGSRPAGAMLPSGADTAALDAEGPELDEGFEIAEPLDLFRESAEGPKRMDNKFELELGQTQTSAGRLKEAASQGCNYSNYHDLESFSLHRSVRKTPVRLVDRKHLMCVGRNPLSRESDAAAGLATRQPQSRGAQAGRQILALSSKDESLQQLLWAQPASRAKETRASLQYPPGARAGSSTRHSGRHSSSMSGRPARMTPIGPASLLVKGERTTLADDPFALAPDPVPRATSTTQYGRFHKASSGIKPLLRGAYARQAFYEYDANSSYVS